MAWAGSSEVTRGVEGVLDEILTPWGGLLIRPPYPFRGDCDRKRRSDPGSPAKHPMHDLIYLSLMIALFAGAVLYVRLCAQL